MKFIKYKKYVPEPASEMSMEDLLNALSDYLLQSGFQQQYMDYYDLNDAEQTLDEPAPGHRRSADEQRHARRADARAGREHERRAARSS